MLLVLLLVAGQLRAEAPSQVRWQEGAFTRTGYVSPRLVVERTPTSAQAEAMLRLDGAARVVMQTATVRVWSVTDAARVLRELEWARAVLFDVPSFEGRWRAPLGAVCDGVERPLAWRAALESGCPVNFWSKATVR